MKTTSLLFIPFLFLSFCGCWILKGRLKKWTLLVMNTLFALTFVRFHFIYLLAATLISYCFGVLLHKYKNKALLILSCFVMALSLFVMKFVPSYLFSSWTIPVGISFYTFKIISYLADLYQGKCEWIRNPVDYYCYVSFFPTLSAGPIHRAQPFIKELNRKKYFDYTYAKNGAVLCAMGMFEKLVFTDYIAIITSSLFSSNATGISLIFGLVLYSFQIYLDFDSYSNIAIGAARCLGFDVGENFKTPYLAHTIQDFWRRWHISLSTWFKDYVYIPLGGNRKGVLRRYLNLLVVFGLSGLWHGISLNFLIWGLGHGFLQIIEDFLGKAIPIKTNLILRLFQVFVNFILVTILWVFFRCNSFIEAMKTIFLCFSKETFQLSYFGINERQLIWLVVILVTVIILDLCRYKTRMVEWLGKRIFLIRWFVYISLILIFLIFGIYGSGYNPQDFIYQSF